MCGKSRTSSNTDIKSILLIGSNCINNQFIQREIEKSSQFSFHRESSEDLEESSSTQAPDIVLISYLVLINSEHIDQALSYILSDNWVIYDVPNDPQINAIANIQLFSMIHLKGIIYQDAPVEHLSRCLCTVSNNDFWLPRKVMAQMLAEARPYAMSLQEAQTDLTKRELQVFKKLIEGASNIDISEDLFISESTVKTHIYKIYKKLKVTNRKEAIRKAANIIEV